MTKTLPGSVGPAHQVCRRPGVGRGLGDHGARPDGGEPVGVLHRYSCHAAITNPTDALTSRGSDLDLRARPGPPGRPETTSTTCAMWYRAHSLAPRTTHQDPDQVRTESAWHSTFPLFVAGQKRGQACTTKRRRTCWCRTRRRSSASSRHLRRGLQRRERCVARLPTARCHDPGSPVRPSWSSGLGRSAPWPPSPPARWAPCGCWARTWSRSAAPSPPPWVSSRSRAPAHARHTGNDRQTRTGAVGSDATIELLNQCPSPPATGVEDSAVPGSRLGRLSRAVAHC